MENTTPRIFSQVLKKIYELLPEDLANKLNEKSKYWAPELCWNMLSQFLNDNITPSASDENSVRIYAVLCNMTEKEMREAFRVNGDL